MIIIRGVFIISSPLRHPALLLRVPPLFLFAASSFAPIWPLQVRQPQLCSSMPFACLPLLPTRPHTLSLSYPPARPSNSQFPTRFPLICYLWLLLIPLLLPVHSLSPTRTSPYLTYYYLFAFSIRKDPGVPDMMLSLSAAPLGLSASTPFASICKS